MAEAIRNPAHEYFRWKMPYFLKTVDDWEQWNTEEKYDRTLFIGVDDTDPLHLSAVLYMIYAGKPVAVIGTAMVAQMQLLSAEVKQAIEEVQVLLEQAFTIVDDIATVDAKIKALAVQVEQTLDKWNVDSQALLEQMEAIQADVTAKQTDVTVKAASASSSAESALQYATNASQSATAASASAESANSAKDAAAASESAAFTSSEACASYAASAHLDANSAQQSAREADVSEGLAQSSATKATEAEATVRELVKTVIFGNIGDIGFSILDVNETSNLRRKLNGQIIPQASFKTFTSRLKSAIESGAVTAVSESEWQTELENSGYGVCCKFVVDDSAGTIRLPKFPTWNFRSVGTVPVVGNGKVLGLTTGLDNFTIFLNGDSGSNPSRQVLGESTVATGTALPTMGIATDASNRKAVGLATTAEASGVVADCTNPISEDKMEGVWYIQVASGIDSSLDDTVEYQLNNPFSLLDSRWTEYAIDNASWLLANGLFQSAATYPAVYQLLVQIHGGSVSKDGVSVKFVSDSYTDFDFVVDTSNNTFRLPTKSKLASGCAVAGNGMALGINTGSNEEAYKLSGLRVGDGSQSGVVLTAPDYYGVEVGTKPSSTRSPTTGAAAGITTDASKSGIETSSSGLRLYYYVGETIQDANVINASAVLTKVSQCIDSNILSDREKVLSWGIPAWDTEVQISGTEYTATYKCWLIADSYLLNNPEAIIYVNGRETGREYEDYTNVQIPVDVGDVISSNVAFVHTSIFAMKGLVND